jgi:hypothetical protein
MVFSKASALVHRALGMARKNEPLRYGTVVCYDLAYRENKTLRTVFSAMIKIERQMLLAVDKICDEMGSTFAKELDPATLSDLDCAIYREPMERVDNREPEDLDLIELEAEARTTQLKQTASTSLGTSASKLGYPNQIKQLVRCAGQP